MKDKIPEKLSQLDIFKNYFFRKLKKFFLIFLKIKFLDLIKLCY